MNVIKRILLFINNYIKQFKRKWIQLPLLFFFPLFIVGLTITLFVFLILPDENNPIKIGIVDYDQSEETKVIIRLLEQSDELGPFIKIKSIEEAEAKEQMLADELSAYISFPKHFTSDLYVGKSVSLDIIGNKNRETESYIVKELLDSIVRHIRTSQASILMINEHAKKLGMSMEEREELIFESFISSFLNVLGKDQLVSEEKVKNDAFVSPIHYYAISIVFILTFIWLMMTYNILYQEEAKRIFNRMRLYSVTYYEQIISRFIVTLIVTALFTMTVTAFIQYSVNFNLYGEDIVRIFVIVFLHSIIFLQILALCELLINSERLRLLSQVMIMLFFIGVSGAILPTTYLPLSIQQWIIYFPSYHSLYWLQQILLKDRLYADFQLLIVYVIVGFVLLSILSIVKERVRE